MSLWSWFKRRADRPREPPDRNVPAAGVSASAESPTDRTDEEQAPDGLSALKALATTDAALGEQALAELRAARGTPLERAALDWVVRATTRGQAPEPLRVMAAELFVERGQAEQALALLARAASIPALMLSADLAAGAGEVARAVTLVERVLARDIETPGAAERHGRWRGWLGNASPTPPQQDHATVLRGDSPQTPLRIVGEAGRGGAGTVYEAIDDVLGRRVALKVYHRPDQERDKLSREARHAVALVGRGVVRIFDADPLRGFIVMEWLPAGALKQWLRRQDAEFLWPADRWFRPLCQAVGRVHDRGMVHADIKPANVLFRSSDEPVLTDFGLCQEQGASSGGGSRGYLSPERLEGQPLAVSDDIYALGRLLEDTLEVVGDDGPGVLQCRRLVDEVLGPAPGRPRSAPELANRVSEALAP